MTNLPTTISWKFTAGQGSVSLARPCKKARDYITKAVLSFFRTGLFFSTTYCGSPSL